MAAKKGFARTPSDLRTVLRRIEDEFRNGVDTRHVHSLAEGLYHAKEALAFIEEYIELGEAEAV